MLQVKKELCLGCGLCILNCPSQAISLLWGKAEINQGRCISCYQCYQICPQAAIGEEVTISTESLKATIAAMRYKVDELSGRIERLRAKLGY